jgi:hypothetical protein
LSRGSEVLAEVKFDDLCSPCQKTVSGYLQHISKKLEGSSPVREPKTKAEVEKKAAPVQAPHVGVPAQQKRIVS